MRLFLRIVRRLQSAKTGLVAAQDPDDRTGLTLPVASSADQSQPGPIRTIAFPTNKSLHGLTMSDNWLMFIPIDPLARPTQAGADKALELLKSFARNAGGEVRAAYSDKVEFHDCGSNWSGVECPQCGKDIEEWWANATDNAYKSRFEDLRVMTPCCGHSTTLNDLNYVWPAGFAQFVLEAKNPNIRQTTAEQDRALSEALGLDLKKIWRHI